MDAPPFTIGVAGHVDHGKTALVRALTGIDTDRRVEEKARGLSIESGVAALKLPSGRTVALIDVPGHTDFLKNTIRGLNGVDMAILVVAADDGVMPQTREHLEILKSFNVSSGLVVLSKTDLVDEETSDLLQG
jgi:selenocysteine-specific elongation factor